MNVERAYHGSGAAESCKNFNLFRRVCAIFGLVDKSGNTEYGVFLVDSNHVHESQRDVQPNVRLRGFGYSCFCVLDSMIYTFVHKDYRMEDGAARAIYSFKLSQQISEHVIVEKKLLDLEMETSKTANMLLGSKSRPAAVTYGTQILVFSTEIPFVVHEICVNSIDFELYNANENMSKKLPCLSVRRPIHGGDYEFELWHLDTNEWEEFDVHWFPERRELPRRCNLYSHFDIDSFCLVGRKFVVQTNFSKQFCLDLESPTKGWQLHEGGMFRAKQTYVADNGLHLDAYGGYYMKVDHDYRPCKYLGPRDFPPPRKHYEVGKCVDFPIPISYGPDGPKSCITLLRDFSLKCSICTVHVGTDVPDSLYWYVDCLKLNLSKFTPDDDEGKEVEENEHDPSSGFVECVTSSKFESKFYSRGSFGFLKIMGLFTL